MTKRITFFGCPLVCAAAQLKSRRSLMKCKVFGKTFNKAIKSCASMG